MFLTNTLKLIFHWTLQWLFEAIAKYLTERKELKDREELQKKQAAELLKKLEEAKISLRTTREKTWNDIQDKEKSGIISEDLKFKLKDEMQKIIEDSNKAFEDLTLKKEKEIKQ
jgi:ribosome recycling factor